MKDLGGPRQVHLTGRLDLRWVINDVAQLPKGTDSHVRRVTHLRTDLVAPPLLAPVGKGVERLLAIARGRDPELLHEDRKDVFKAGAEPVVDGLFNRGLSVRVYPIPVGAAALANVGHHLEGWVDDQLGDLLVLVGIVS